MKNLVSRLSASALLLALVGASASVMAAPAVPTTAVALATGINFADANSAQLIATAALITLFVTAAGASIVISRIKKAKSA
jgi:hypothetical protein